MRKFILKKSNEANIYKSIHFTIETNNRINEIVKRANKNKKIIVLMACS